MSAATRPTGRTIVLVGLMGAGKTTIGRRLAAALRMPFRDADAEIEAAAGCSISGIFARYGEAAFRDGERKVIARLLDEPPHVLATGGGAFIDPQTRHLINSRAISVWLRADLGLLARRVSRRDTRPLLAGKDPLEVLEQHAQARYPDYAEAHFTIDTGDVAHHRTVDAIIATLAGKAAVRP